MNVDRHILLFTTILLAVASVGCSSSQDELVWEEEDGFRWAPLSVSGSDQPGFDVLPGSRTGVTFENSITGEELAANRNLLNGSGVAVGDIDGDGLPDVYFCHLAGDNALYRNLGNWRFEDITATAGVAAPGRYATGAVLVDVDGDADLDLLVTALGGPNAAFENDGSGLFTEVTEEWGLQSNRGSTTLALADVDGDADLDLYVGNYKRIALRDTVPPQEIGWDAVVKQVGEKEWTIAPEWKDHWELMVIGTKIIRLERGEGDWFYLNDGNGTFTRETLDSGRFFGIDGLPYEEEPRDWALEVQFHDVNRDGHPDLYVCNDFESPDYIWLNDGNGNFHSVGYDVVRRTSNSTMSIDFSDIDRDGDVDFFQSDMLDPSHHLRQIQMATGVPLPTTVGGIHARPQTMQNTMFVQREDGTYSEIGRYAGVRASGWSWSVNFLDVDLDGYEDALVSTGNVFDIQNSDAQARQAFQMSSVRSFSEFRELILEFPDLRQKNVLYRNTGDYTFESTPDGWGFGSVEDISQGFAFGDFDNDGDLDVVANRLREEAALYRNRTNKARIAVRLKGQAPNTAGIGAQVILHGGDLIQEKEVASGGAYVSGSQEQVMFAVPEGELKLEVRWRSGVVSVVDSVQGNRIYEVFEGRESRVESLESRRGTVHRALADSLDPASGNPQSATRDSRTPLFVQTPFPHRHYEAEFDDFQIQPLIPRRLSRVGPAVAVVDLDEDGWTDLVMGGGSGSDVIIYRNEQGNLREWKRIAAVDSRHDFGGIVAAAMEPGVVRLLIAESSYESGTESSIQVHHIENGVWSQSKVLTFGRGAVGHLSLADVDGDADLDLFAASRVFPGRYPEGGSSKVYLFNQGEWVYSEAWSRPFQDAGMVSSSAFGDIDKDGDADLVLATEWGPVRFFLNTGTEFEEATDQWGLQSSTGWWNGVSLGDLDSDGSLDIVATNWGWNSRYGIPENEEFPHRLYWGDFEGDGFNELVESRFVPENGGYVPERGFGTISRAIPAVRNWIRTYTDFAAMGVDDVLGRNRSRFTFLEANTLGHTVFMNGGASFEGEPLALEAQLSVALAVSIVDADLDGAEDLVLGQNFFGVPIHDARQDGGRGLLLQGDETGALRPVQGSTSGIRAYGEQRGIGIGDFDKDNRVDLIISQNGEHTVRLQGRQVQPGVSINLHGPEGNRWGIGAGVRMAYEDGSLGPARLVSAGDGYLSQMSPTVVLGLKQEKKATGVHVSWPDGTARTYEMAGTGQINITMSEIQ